MWNVLKITNYRTFWMHEYYIMYTPFLNSYEENARREAIRKKNREPLKNEI